MRILALAVLCALGACGDGRPTDQAGVDENMKIIVQDQIRARLRDPESAVFTGVHLSRKSGVPAVCGQVNSRNGFGGMTGPQGFIGGGMTLLEQDFAPGEFEQSWQMMC